MRNGLRNFQTQVKSAVAVCGQRQVLGAEFGTTVM